MKPNLALLIALLVIVTAALITFVAFEAMTPHYGQWQHQVDGVYRPIK